MPCQNGIFSSQTKENRIILRMFALTYKKERTIEQLIENQNNTL